MNHIRIGESMFICILCGTMSGCGGGLICDYLGFFRENSFMTYKPSMFEVNNYKGTATLTRSFILAILYYILITPYYTPWVGYTILDKNSGHTVVILIQVINMCIQELLGNNYDLFTLLAVYIQKLLLLPTIIQPVIHAPTHKPTANITTTTNNTTVGIMLQPVLLQKSTASNSAVSQLLSDHHLASYLSDEREGLGRPLAKCDNGIYDDEYIVEDYLNSIIDNNYDNDDMYDYDGSYTNTSGGGGGGKRRGHKGSKKSAKGGRGRK